MGANVASDDEEGKKVRGHQEKMKKILVRALVNKAHAEASLGNVDAMKATLKNLECWGAIDKFFMLRYREALLSEKYGLAMKYLRSMIGVKKDEAGELPADHFLWKEAVVIFDRLGWDAWKDYAKKSFACRFPKEIL